MKLTRSSTDWDMLVAWMREDPELSGDADDRGEADGHPDGHPPGEPEAPWIEGQQATCIETEELLARWIEGKALDG